MCESGKYFSEANKTCVDCEDKYCGVCTGPGTGTCIQCNSAVSVILYGKCIDCSISNTCTNKVCVNVSSSLGDATVELPGLEERTVNELEDGNFGPPERDISSFIFSVPFRNLKRFDSILKSKPEIIQEILDLTLEGLTENTDYTKTVEYDESTYSLIYRVKLNEDANNLTYTV